MNRKYLKGFIIAGVVVILLTMAFQANAGHDEDFRQASDLNYYPGITNLQSAQLDINLASVIHQENLQILQTLQELEERVNKLETSVRTIEREVVSR